MKVMYNKPGQFWETPVSPPFPPVLPELLLGGGEASLCKIPGGQICMLEMFVLSDLTGRYRIGLINGEIIFTALLQEGPVELTVKAVIQCSQRSLESLSSRVSWCRI